jgi:rfaE bifunctional protein nucleotidyltransferase chain/domain
MRIVLASGCFDMFHVAHLRYLQNARAMGDYLVVSVTRDKFVGKGEGRPIIPEAERLEIVQSLNCVDQAILYNNGYDALKEWKPDIFCKGDDWRQDWRKPSIPDEIKDFCKKNGIQISFTPPNPQTTSNIIERVRQCA